MENKEETKSQIKIQLPIRLDYAALEEVMREKAIGEEIKTESSSGKTTSYAEILDISFDQSLDEDFDLVIDLEFRTLTTLYKNKEGNLLLHVKLEFDELEQEIYVSKFKLKVNTSSWLLNNSMEGIANRIMRGKIKEKMKFDFRPEIQKRLKEINQKLVNEMEVAEGIFVFGYLDKFEIQEIIPKPSQFLLLVNFEGSTVVDIKKLSF